MGSYDGVEICELIGAYILNQVPTEELQTNIRLYHHDGLTILNDQPRQVENMKKAICQIFKSAALRITIEVNKKIINFLNDTINLLDATQKPFKKSGNTPTYIHQSSNPFYLNFHLMKNASIAKPIFTRKSQTAVGITLTWLGVTRKRNRG